MRRQTENPHIDHTRLVTLEIKDQTGTTGATGALGQNAHGKAGRVLVLEDRDDFREILRDHLVFRGYEVVSVPSGVEGLAEIKKNVFDLIICDMMMPRSGGEMFYWAVTRLRPAAAKRFIFFTGHRNQPNIEFFFRRVNAAVLLKPFPLAALDATMTSVLRSLI